MTEVGAGFETYILPYSQVVAVISTATIAVSAAITAILTWRLIRYNRRLSKVGTEPEVIAYLAADPFQPFTNFVLANVGRGPARNVEFELALEVDQYDRMVLRNEPNRKPQGFLLQGEKTEMLFGDHRLFGIGEARERNALPPFEVVVKWQNLRGRTFEDTYTLDVRQFLGVPPTSSLFSPLSKFASSLAKIEKSLSGWKV